MRIQHCLTLVPGCYNKISIHHDLVINGLRKEAHVAETSNLYKPGVHMVNYYQGAPFVAIYATQSFLLGIKALIRLTQQRLGSQPVCSSRVAV